MKNATVLGLQEKMELVTGYLTKAFAFLTDKMGWVGDYVKQYLGKAAEALGMNSFANIVNFMQLMSSKPGQLKTML